MTFRSIHENEYAGKLPRIPAIFRNIEKEGRCLILEHGSGSKYIIMDDVEIRVSHHPGPAHYENNFEVGPHVNTTFEDIIPNLVIESAKSSAKLEDYADITETDRIAWIKWWVGRELKSLTS